LEADLSSLEAGEAAVGMVAQFSSLPLVVAMVLEVVEQLVRLLQRAPQVALDHILAVAVVEVQAHRLVTEGPVELAALVEVAAEAEKPKLLVKLVVLEAMVVVAKLL
jgi:hypothetical protein